MSVLIKDMEMSKCPPVETSEPCNDAVSRQAVLDLIADYDLSMGQVVRGIHALPSAEPEPSEITDEQAILHLQSTGWMQNHDREMYESGLRENKEKYH